MAIRTVNPLTRASVAERRPARDALKALEERYRNELMGVEERAGLRDRILRLRRKAGRS